MFQEGSSQARCLLSGFGCSGVALLSANAQQRAYVGLVTPVMHSNGDFAPIIEE
jgi:hypothetical protein